ncbi:hypothetical protein AAFF_G00156820 [Aldrovandia affinis]|uniref:BHLH domain-containing protein n=1 Tax=Aldrovandia affinis TaxID=143900 RepID=A0AAD7RNI5_9TELE|nr:hypothetical protein AAFF_G00156820 [Aldrovandia affinis]
MKPIKATQIKELKKTRKLLKSEVERHRRVRMNRSLESLRVLLLKEPQHQGLSSRRVEKAEILEHTVLFLQKTGVMATHEGAEQQRFQDGFLACLQRAAQFLQVEDKGQQTERALTDTLSLHLLRPTTQETTSRLSTGPPQTLPKVLSVRSWKEGWSYRQQLCAAIRDHHSPHHRASLAHGDLNIPQCHHRNAPASLYSSPTTQSQAMWRPWS